MELSYFLYLTDLIMGFRIWNCVTCYCTHLYAASEEPFINTTSYLPIGINYSFLKCC